MDLSTHYLGLDLPHPFVPGASPLSQNLDTVKRLEDAGAPLITMHSLFEEQLTGEQLATHRYMDEPAESFGEALSYMPVPPDYALGPEEYLGQIRKLKEAVSVPVVASLNGNTSGGWLDFAKLMEEAGADALELNIYEVATDLGETSEVLEGRVLEAAKTVIGALEIPVAVKLSPFYTSFGNLAQSLDAAGVAGLVLFNRFYQADIDVEELEVVPALHLSDSSELLLRLRWLAILSGRVGAPLAVTGGIHSVTDAVKSVMAGASAIQVVSALLKRGPEQLKSLRDEMADWMERHEYESLQQMTGSMNLIRCPDPKAFERANYTRVLQSWKAYM